MSEPLSKVKILLDIEDPSERLHFVVLDHNTRWYMSVKISSALEIVERGKNRNYKSPLRNPYMIFRNDVLDAWKESKKFRKYPESFKDISLLWNNLPKNVIDIYDQIYIDYKELIPKFKEFVPYEFQEVNTNENIRAENNEGFMNNSETCSGEFQHNYADPTMIYVDYSYANYLGDMAVDSMETYIQDNGYTYFSRDMSVGSMETHIQKDSGYDDCSRDKLADSETCTQYSQDINNEADLEKYLNLSGME